MSSAFIVAVRVRVRVKAPVVTVLKGPPPISITL